MLDYEAPDSSCRMCGKTYGKRGIGRHVTACLKKRFSENVVKGAKNFCHLQVSDPYGKDYFLHLLVPPGSSLDDLDSYLRDIWLECCGHLSSFSQGRWGDELPMNLSIEALTRDGVTLNYVYDFGSSTELVVKFIKVYNGFGDDEIELLVRNAQPIYACNECGKLPAVKICTECSWDGEGWLCRQCAEKHSCDEYMFLPVVNSPRVGVCGYDGGVEDNDDECDDEPKEGRLPESLVKTINEMKSRKKKSA